MKFEDGAADRLDLIHAGLYLCVQTLHDLPQLAGIPDLLLKFGHRFGQIAHFASPCLDDRQVSLKVD